MVVHFTFKEILVTLLEKGMVVHFTFKEILVTLLEKSLTVQYWLVRSLSTDFPTGTAKPRLKVSIFVTG
jgi:hypothetical protein